MAVALDVIAPVAASSAGPKTASPTGMAASSASAAIAVEAKAPAALVFGVAPAFGVVADGVVAARVETVAGRVRVTVFVTT